MGFKGLEWEGWQGLGGGSEGGSLREWKDGRSGELERRLGGGGKWREGNCVCVLRGGCGGCGGGV